MPISDGQLNACLEVMRDAILQARIWGSNRNVPAEQLADLMHAIHNIPIYIQNWDDLGVHAIREALQEYDDKWRESLDGTRGLVHVYDYVLSKLEPKS